MDNSDVSSQKVTKQEAPEQGATSSKNNIIIAAIVIVIAILFFLLFAGDESAIEPVNKPEPVSQIKEKATAPEAVIEDVVDAIDTVDQNTPLEESATLPEPTVLEPVEVIENPLPILDESDVWIKTKLPELTWRTELLQLVIDDDMIRRFVVFTDNFAQGAIAYEHSPFVLPAEKFDAEQTSSEQSADKPTWQWNEATSKRFDTYIDLLRSMDSTTLVDSYFEAKPLIDKAYSELGYEDDFTLTLQDAITRVLDMELPKADMTLTRPSVMYKYQSSELENLPDSDKLLLRLGKENLLVIKSVLLEINEKLAKEKNGLK
ncbi:DUF3014 domain-containing protein [Colwellia sp. D2M02]|uniref:DUF3014 domain-containing protein n=1 Tax=Colwellia sp. D2M02 TaxID=2841562 RepID=UPI001C08487A|nr:DUF3014 domain-containing protein [Colwellia sp. D2M02]MBU2894934.1 DUF3014 domain-containing protein [Colwellia sp. D2M02]